MQISFAASPVLGFTFIRPGFRPGPPKVDFKSIRRRRPEPQSSGVQSCSCGPTRETEGRNDIPGFGLTQFDFSLAKSFPCRNGMHLQFVPNAFTA